MVWLLEILDTGREFVRGDTQVFKCPLITSRFWLQYGGMKSREPK